MRTKNVVTGKDIIRLMRESWESKLDELSSTFKLAKGNDVDALSNGLKIRHKESGLLYTVDTIGTRDVTLSTPDGEKFTVSRDDINSLYELD